MKVQHKDTRSSYEILFTSRIKESIGSLSKNYNKIAVVTDTNIWSIYSKSLKGKKILNILVKPGEKSKSIKIKNEIEEKLLENNFNRKSLIVAVGGGVIGDLVGFTASTFMRGIDLVHIPTSLVAIVDSSIGGKTAIDNRFGKNLIGTFYNPKEILVDLNFLSSLSNKEIRQGMAEIIKYSIIDNEKLFKTLESINTSLLSNKKSIIERIIKTCMEIKIRTIKEDFKEGDKRMILNFGHTVGHAFEKLFNYKKSHGDCIGLGMLIEAKISQEINQLSYKDYEKIKSMLQRFNLLNLKISKSSNKKLLSFMRLDKKNSSKKITFSIPERIGTIHKSMGKHSIEINDKIIEKAMNKVINEIKN
jgi:3-dehydroquinate synthase